MNEAKLGHSLCQELEPSGNALETAKRTNGSKKSSKPRTTLKAYEPNAMLRMLRILSP